MAPMTAGLRERLRPALDPDPTPVPPPGDRLAAVLVPVVEGAQAKVVFTRRARHLPRHAGEISFPGGLAHDDDPDLRATALRESEEELGIAPGAVDVLGSLAPVHTTVSGILIVPFVGMLASGQAFTPSVGEIAEVLVFPLAGLAAAEEVVTWNLGQHVYRGFAYPMEGGTVWGATARILHALLEVLRREAPWALGG